MKAGMYCRVSGEEQEASGTSLQTQEQACLDYAKRFGLEVDQQRIYREVFSGLTLNRPKLGEVLAALKHKAFDHLIIYSTDRFSRNGYDLLTLIRECELNSVQLHCVTEDLGQGAVGELLSFIRGWASGLEAQRIKERTMRGKRKCAEEGRIVGGFGRYSGYLGLHYEPENRMLRHTSQIGLAKEILLLCLQGLSHRDITRKLQARGEVGVGGGLIHRSSVNRVLHNSHVYAGIVRWDGIEITGKVEPIITEQQSQRIQRQLKLNREKAKGFGRRRPLTGRVFCALCGRRYNLNRRKGCKCNGADPTSGASCSAPTVGLRTLEGLVYHALLQAALEPEALKAVSAQWAETIKPEMEAREASKEGLEAEREQVEKRRRLLSVQEELGGLAHDEYVQRLRVLLKRRDEIDNALADIETVKRARPNPEAIEAAFSGLVKTLDISDDDNFERLLDELDARIYVIPAEEPQKWSLDICLNIPVLFEMVTDSYGKQIAMLLNSSFDIMQHSKLSILLRIARGGGIEAVLSA